MKEAVEGKTKPKNSTTEKMYDVYLKDILGRSQAYFHKMTDLKHHLCICTLNTKVPKISQLLQNGYLYLELCNKRKYTTRSSIITVINRGLSSKFNQAGLVAYHHWKCPKLSAWRNFCFLSLCTFKIQVALSAITSDCAVINKISPPNRLSSNNILVKRQKLRKQKGYYARDI